MKSENENFEKNISRLVKLAGDSNQPNKAFTDSLIKNATDELSQADTTRERKNKIMTTKKILAYAALFIVVCSVTVAVLMPSLNKSKEYSHRIAKLDEKKLQQSSELKQLPASEPLQWQTDGKSQSIQAATKGETARALDKTQTLSMSMGHQKEQVLYEYFDDSSGYARKREAGCLYQKVPPMANGGSVPPNGDKVDAMFFKNYGVNPFIDTEDDHLSTFATDVDTASYTVVRNYLHDGHLPPNDAVRVEEFVNYFKYDYPAPKNEDFAVYSEAAPWQFGTNRPNSILLRLALKGRQISDEERKPAILTFVIDVSGSMQREDRLELVKKSLRLLIDNLKPEDKIGIAVYQTRGRKVMGYKGLDEKDDILAVIDSLHAEGSTNAEEGIRIGYEMAERAFRQDCINRVILCTDGVANEGHTGAADILKVIKEKADKGITLSAIGFGMGNYNDVLLEQLGDKGNGHYAYVDTLAEAKRIFEKNLNGTIEVIARDVKLQVDFNPDVVRSYRLIGYENRDVPDNKFRDDKYDGGEVGAGHSVTALYELKLWPGKKGRISTTYVRYKNAETDSVTEFKSVFDSGKIKHSFDDSGGQFRLAATAAQFAEILRQSYWAKGATLESVLQEAQTLCEEFKGNKDVKELVDLISKANQLTGKTSIETTDESASE